MYRYPNLSSQRPAIISGKEHGPTITIDDIKEMIQDVVNAARSPQTRSLLQEFASLDGDTVFRHKEQLIVVIQQLIGAKDVPISASMPT
jgi:hypothetical protein